ncbi:MAG TPA: hypothetical protein VFE78_20290, partial [Gemmataceae bacterium]|nr:hypothetical protein [Gemmataceae bacterium]
MPINFNCPHCHKPLKVKDELAGKKGPCPVCKKPLVVPKPAAAPKAAATPPAPASNGPPAPAPAPAVDVEAEAAALFADGPAKAEAPPQFIDFPCPQCDEPLHLDAALAGKKAQCPSCRRIIAVPLLKTEKKDWRSLDTRLPSGAQRPTEPVPEGTWSSTATSRVSNQALDEAGLIKPKRVPLTAGQKVRRGLLAAGAVAAVAVVAVVGWKWWAAGRQERALKHALAFVGSEAGKSYSAAGRAALHTGAGEYYLRTRQPQCGKLAEGQFGNALNLLRTAGASDPDREVALAELALAQVGLGGGPEDLEREKRLTWDNTQKLVKATLGAIATPEARLEALRGVAGRLIARGQPKLAVSLINLLYSDGEDKAEAQAVVALELLKAGDEERAKEAAVESLKVYAPDHKPRPRLRAPVVVLAMALKKAPPAPEKNNVEDEKQDVIGQAEGLARQGKWDEARARARAGNNYGPEVALRALVGVAAAAVDAKADGKSDLEAAVAAAPAAQRLPEAAWPLLRLTRLAARAGLPEDQQNKVAGAIADPTVRGQAQLDVLRARLAAAPQVVGEDAAGKVDAKSLAHQLG